MRRTITNNNYRHIFGDIMGDSGIFDDSPDKLRKTKGVILSRLTQSEQTIIVLYAELGSFAKLGVALGIPKSTIQDEVKRIQRKIKSAMQ